MNRLSEVYKLKDGILGEPDRYLSSNIEKVQLDEGSVVWSMTSREYVTNVIQNLEDTLARDSSHPLNIFGKNSGERPFSSNYCTELDVSAVIYDTFMSRYLQLIGVCRRAI